MLRPLADTIIDAVASVQPHGRAAGLLRVSAVELDLPVEVRLTAGPDGPVFRADLPRNRWQTGFDPQWSRLRLVCREEVV